VGADLNGCRCYFFEFENLDKQNKYIRYNPSIDLDLNAMLSSARPPRRDGLLRNIADPASRIEGLIFLRTYRPNSPSSFGGKMGAYSRKRYDFIS
jgi:hypothetical protein